MFKFGRAGYTFPYQNKYKLVFFQPTKEKLEMSILQLGRDFDGHYSVLEMFLKNNGLTRVSELFENTDLFYDLIYQLHNDEFPDYLIGIQEIETGYVEYKFHCGIYDYQPDNGYVILQKHSDRDYIWGVYSTFRVHSLRTGKDLEGDFVEDISGIRNLKFEAVIAHSREIYPAVYEIDELNQKIKALGYVIEEEFNQMDLPRPNHRQFEEFEIEEIDNYDFYKRDESFISYIERKGQVA